jgi:uncharacterized repeat protein (TIGR02543 family)
MRARAISLGCMHFFKIGLLFRQRSNKREKNSRLDRPWSWLMHAALAMGLCGWPAVEPLRAAVAGAGYSVVCEYSSAIGYGPVGELVQGPDGALYGVSSGDGVNRAGLGVIYKVNRDGTGLVVLRRFTGENGDGALPYCGVTAGSDGALYGMTSGGGDMSDSFYPFGKGVIYKINPDGSGYAILKTFRNVASDGAMPLGRLLQGSDGVLYGTTQTGTVFRINRDGTGFAVLRSQMGQPWAGLIQASDGMLYGTMGSTLFRLNRDGTGYAVIKTLTDQMGNMSRELIEGRDGALYGTSETGGPNGFSQGTVVYGKGTVYKINKDGTGFVLLKTFTGQGSDPSAPRGGVVQGRDGALYGTTYGTIYDEHFNVTQGSIYKLNTDGTGFTVLKACATFSDGDSPASALMLANDGVFYGTMRGGGTQNSGVVYAYALPPTGRISGLSIRTAAGTGDQTLIVGFIIAGGNKSLLVRGVGPGLAQYGVSGFLADPQLALFNNSTQIDANDNWSTSANASSIAATAVQLQNFPLSAGSRDAAMLASLNDGLYTAQVSGVGNTTGIALVEVYDATTTAVSHLTGVSARAQVGTGDNILIAGFILTGDVPKQVLVRGVGPTLAAYGVAGALADPQLTVFSAAGTAIASNDNWSTAANAGLVAAAAAQLYDFALPVGSKDAALLLTLNPGTYTAQVAGVGNTTGVALIEVYEVTSLDSSASYALTLGANTGTGHGTITASPAASTYTVGTVVTLTATPAAGSTFAGWTGGSTGTTNPLQVSVGGNLTIAATFNLAATTTYTLTTATNGTGQGTISASPAGPTYTAGTTVTLTGTAASGSTFAGWSGDGTGSTTRQVVMDGNKTVTATFNLTPATTYTLTTATNGTGQGTISASPAGPTYAAGATVTLTATAASGSAFAGWSGDGTGSTTRQVIMDGNKSVTATFNLTPATTYTLTTATNGTGVGTISASPAGPTYTAGATVTLTATPAAGSTFAGWSGAASGSAATAQVTMTGNLSVTATFNTSTSSNGASSTLRVLAGQSLLGSYDPFRGNSVVNGGTLFADGGQPFGGYTWSLSNLSALPAGVALAPNGLVTWSGGAVLPRGTPYTFNVTVSDGVRTASGDISITIGTESTAAVGGIPGTQFVADFQQLMVGSFTLVSGRTGYSYGATVYAGFGTGSVVTSPVPLTWTVAAGYSLPPGLTLDAARGVIYGTPTTLGTYQFKIVVKDRTGAAAIGSPTYSITIGP